MKISLKLLLSTIVVMALALGFSGFYFVNYVFETSLEREIGQALDENSILRFAFETAELNVPLKYDLLQDGSVERMQSSSSLPGDVDEMVGKLVERSLVSEPGRGAPEVRLTLGGGVLAGAELALSRAVDGQLSVCLSCVDAASFQTAVGARDALQAALERNGENVHVEVTRGSDASGGREGDARRRSATYAGWSEKD